MRWIGWACAGSVLLLVGAAVAYAGCDCNGNNGASYRAYGGPACFTPPGFCSAPGCCECQPTACDNAWDGYCDHKARWQAYFYTVGVPKMRCGGCCMVPVSPSCHCSAEILPAIEPRPTPVEQPTKPAALPSKPTPGKNAWKWTNPWIR